MQIKFITSCHLTPSLLQWLLPKRQEITRVSENVEKMELLCTVGAKQYGGFSKIKNEATI